jgi:beta-glucanase (GH16 family)
MSASRVRRNGGRLAIAAVLSALLLPGIPTLTAGSGAVAATGARTVQAAARTADQAKPKQPSSWKTVRTEEFSGSDMPDGCEAYVGEYSAGKNAWSSRQVDVSGGLLQLALEKRRTSGQPYTSGAIGCWGWPQKYGRYEIKAKVPAGRGIDSSLTLWPAKPGKGSEAAFTGMELLAPGPETAYVTNGYGSRSENARVSGRYAGEFHTYVIEWAPSHVRMTVDGKEIFYSTRSYRGSRWLGLIVSNGDALTGVPDADTKLPAELQIDRVRISSYTGVPPVARAVTKSPSRSRVAGVPTAVPTSIPPTAAATVPSTTAPARVSSLDATAGETGPALTGGVWPWLLGGSLIAVFAIASLNYPHHRRARRATLLRQ